jgi:hypothetical protein
MLASIRPILRAIAATVVPESVQLDTAEWSRLEGIIVDAITPRPPATRRQLLLLIRLIEWLPLVRFGRRFTRLDPGRRTRFLTSLENAPVLLVRRGFWGLRTLLLMGYYGRPGAAREIGYRAAPEGWKARR